MRYLKVQESLWQESIVNFSKLDFQHWDYF